MSMLGVMMNINKKVKKYNMNLVKYTVELTEDELFDLQWALEHNIIRDVKETMERSPDIELHNLLSEHEMDIKLLDSLNGINGSQISSSLCDCECYSASNMIEQIHKELYKPLSNKKKKQI